MVAKTKNSRSAAPTKAKAAAAKAEAVKSQGKPGVSSKRRATRAAVRSEKAEAKIKADPPAPGPVKSEKLDETPKPAKAVIPKNVKSKAIKKQPVATKKKAPAPKK